MICDVRCELHYMSYEIKQNLDQQPAEESCPPAKKCRLNLKLFSRVIFSLVIIAGVYYLVGVNDIVIQSFVLENKKGQAEDLRKEKERLELKAMSLNSYNNLLERVKKVGMVKASEVDYLEILPPAVAKK